MKETAYYLSSRGNEMKLLNMKLNNFRGVEEVNIDFNGKSAIIYGINVMGKSTILHACNLLFSRIFKALTDSNLGYGRDFRIEESDIKIGEDNTRIDMKISLEGKKYDYHRIAERNGKRVHAKTDLKKLSMIGKMEAWREMCACSCWTSLVAGMNMVNMRRFVMPLSINYRNG